MGDYCDEAFTQDVLYPLVAIAIEKFCMSFLIVHGVRARTTPWAVENYD
jgi:hypothetical protein